MAFSFFKKIEIVVKRTLKFTKNLLTFASVKSPPSASPLATLCPSHPLTHHKVLLPKHLSFSHCLRASAYDAALLTPIVL